MASRADFRQAFLGLGLIDSPLPMLFTPGAVAIGFTHVLAPFVMLSVWAALQKCDPNVERAAIALGASRATVFFRIVLPQVVPGLLSGGLVVFALAASGFATPAILGGRMVKVVSMTIYDDFLGSLNWPVGAVVAIILLVLNSLLVWGFNVVFERRYGPVER